MGARGRAERFGRLVGGAAEVTVARRESHKAMALAWHETEHTQRTTAQRNQVFSTATVQIFDGTTYLLFPKEPCRCVEFIKVLDIVQ